MHGHSWAITFWNRCDQGILETTWKVGFQKATIEQSRDSLTKMWEKSRKIQYGIPSGPQLRRFNLLNSWWTSRSDTESCSWGRSSRMTEGLVGDWKAEANTELNSSTDILAPPRLLWSVLPSCFRHFHFERGPCECTIPSFWTRWTSSFDFFNETSIRLCYWDLVHARHWWRVNTNIKLSVISLRSTWWWDDYTCIFGHLTFL